MARPAPGSLAARSDLRNRLTFFKRRQQEQASRDGAITIELEANTNGHGSPEASTASPTSSPRPDQRSATTPSFPTKGDSPSSTPPEVVLRRQQRAGAEGLNSPTSAPASSTTSSLDLSRNWNRNLNAVYNKLHKGSANDMGKRLKDALSEHFERNGIGSGLDEYLTEVFHQLDYHQSGTVSREDFEILCEVVNITVSPPASNRNSGLEWLSSYKPRPNSPFSPLRVDRLAEVKYRSQSGLKASSPPPGPQPLNFLFTIGPRPFWELWPQRKRRKRKLSLDDFKRCLLEQWAKHQGIPQSRLGPLLGGSPAKVQFQADLIEAANGVEHHPGQKSDKSVHLAANLSRPRVARETRTKRLMRSLHKASRRYHILTRLSRRLETSSKVSQPQPPPPPPPTLPCPVHGTDVVDHVPSRSNKKGNNTLEVQVMNQQQEISSLRDVVEDLRSSLQLSDAQNLALQVLLKKMAKTEVQSMPKEDFRTRMNDNEKQLEHLVKELKEMSKIRYPRLNGGVNNNSNYGTATTNSSSTSSHQVHVFSNTDLAMCQEELSNTSTALNGAQSELQATSDELKTTAFRLNNSTNEAYQALEQAQRELNRMRRDLEEAQRQLEATKTELNETQEELLFTQCQLMNSEAQLKDTEKRLSQLSDNRKSLVLELQTTRELLVSSLNKVQCLELESKKVPILERKILKLQTALQANGKSRSELEGKTLPQHLLLLQPLSVADSGLYSPTTGLSDEEDGRKKSLPRKDSGVSPGLSSSTSGHHSAGSPKSPGLLNTSTGSASGSGSGSGMSPAGSETISKLRHEILNLKDKFLSAEKHWNEERNVLLEELIRRQDYPDISSDIQVLEAQRVRLTLLEEKIKEVLAMLRKLNTMNISSNTLGRLVLDSVERSVDPLSKEVQVFKFLNHLYHSARDYERLSTESEIHNALRAVEQHSATLALMEQEQGQQKRPGPGVLSNPVSPPPRSSSLPPRSKSQISRIDV